ncbi:2508_t:CDS:2 [Cetraspora pellucida]|uniref:2508_t:CDS:1 n=1 Tax=Cetraspora pellucida TaxID=1433469 RepID=A0ACA9M5W9_9GLOM|nr:2508_t:CDS:2 [Cetraspora pellucida]
MELTYLTTGIIMIIHSYSWLIDHGDSLRDIVLSQGLLIGGMTVGVLIILSFFVGVIGFFTPFKRDSWLIAHNISIIITMLIILAFGAKIWFKTLDSQKFVTSTWIGWDNNTKAIFEDQLSCCGWDFPLSNGVISKVCPNLRIANSTSISGCKIPLTKSVDMTSRILFTSLFGFIALDLLTILSVSVLMNVRKIEERLCKIEKKGGLFL